MGKHLELVLKWAMNGIYWKLLNGRIINHLKTVSIKGNVMISQKIGSEPVDKHHRTTFEIKNLYTTLLHKQNLPHALPTTTTSASSKVLPPANWILTSVAASLSSQIISSVLVVVVAASPVLQAVHVLSSLAWPLDFVVDVSCSWTWMLYL